MTQSSAVRTVVGKQSLVAQAAMILGALKQAPDHQVSRADVRVLSEVADAFHDADAWRRFCANQGPCVSNDGKEMYELFSRAVGPVKSGDDWVAYWGQIRDVGCSLHVLAQGGKLAPRQLGAAERLCARVSETVAVSSRPRLVQ